MGSPLGPAEGACNLGLLASGTMGKYISQPLSVCGNLLGQL